MWVIFTYIACKKDQSASNRIQVIIKNTVISNVNFRVYLGKYRGTGIEKIKIEQRNLFLFIYYYYIYLYPALLPEGSILLTSVFRAG